MLRHAMIGILLTALGGCATTRSFTATDRRAVADVLAAQAVAWNHGDLTAYMAGYAHTPDLVFSSGGKIRTGWAETLAAYQKRYGGAPETMGHLAFELLQVQPVGADGAIVLGRWRLTATPQAGAGVFSVILERRAEGWRIVHDHTSADPPPP